MKLNIYSHLPNEYYPLFSAQTLSPECNVPPGVPLPQGMYVYCFENFNPILIGLYVR